MYCPNCGKEVADGTAFCTNCGTKLSFSTGSSNEKTATAPAGSGTSTAQAPADKETIKRSNQRAWIILGVVAAIVVILLVVLFLGSGSGQDKEEAKAVATEFLEAVKSVDLETLEEDYAGDVGDINLETDDSTADLPALEDSTADFPEVEDLDSQIFNRHVERLRDFDYSLGEPTVSEGQVSIPVTIKTFDYSSFLENWRVSIKDYIDKNVSSLEEIDQIDLEEVAQQATKAFIQELDSYSKDYTGKFTLYLTKDDNDNWIVNEMSESDLDSFFGGLYSVSKQREEDEEKPIHIGKDNSGVITAYRGKTVAVDAYGLYPYEEDGEMYFITAGSVNTMYEGAMYDDNENWWYVRNGKVDTSENGTVELFGATFEVRNGQVIA